MSVTPQIRVNGGAPQAEYVSAAVGDVIQMTAASYATWGSPVARWWIYDFPSSYALPAGWSLDATSGAYYYDGNGDPPPFTCTEWGRFVVDVYATENSVAVGPVRSLIDIPSASGLRDLGRGEGALYGGDRKRWVKTIQDNNRVIETTIGTLGTPDYLATPNTVPLRDADGDCEFRYVYADQILAQATANVLLGCDAAGYITFWEGVTEVARVFDNGGIRSLTFQGAVAAEVISGGRLDLQAASGNYILLRESTTEVFRISDETNVSTLSGRGSGGTSVVSNSGGLTCQAGAGDLTLQCASTYKLILKEGSTSVAEVYDAANVSTIAGKGSGGTRIAADTGNLVLDCASGSVVRITEGGTTVCDIYDSAGTRHIDFGAATIIDNTASFIAVRASSSYVALEGNDVYLNADTIHFRSEAGTTRAQIVNTGVLVLPVIAAASVSSPSAGSYALFFDSSNSDKLSKKSSGGTVTVIGTES